MWTRKKIEKILSQARDKIAQDLNIIDKNKFAFVGSLTTPCMNLMKNQTKLFLVITHFRCLKEKLMN